MYNIEYLVQETGISRRTIRYYVQRGLLPPPLGNRRGSYYTEEHLTRLKLIHELSQQGTPLIQIKNLIDVTPDRELALPVAEPRQQRQRFERVNLPHGLELNVPQHLLNNQQLNSIRNFIIEVIRGEQENDEEQ
jgi:DNA-binding transcriptional MerR regulator